jgi:TusA-related sulfurtransferase
MSEAVVDARGLSCPEPVLMTQRALKAYGSSAFFVEVSSASARDNVENLLKEKGRAVEVEATAEGWRVKAGAG